MGIFTLCKLNCFHDWNILVGIFFDLIVLPFDCYLDTGAFSVVAALHQELDKYKQTKNTDREAVSEGFSPQGRAVKILSTPPGTSRGSSLYSINRNKVVFSSHTNGRMMGFQGVPFHVRFLHQDPQANIQISNIH